MTSMLRFRLKFLLRNKQTRLILILTVCLSLLITAIGLFSYSRYREELDSELNTPNIELLQINLDVTNRAFRQFDNLAVDASFKPEVIDYIQIQTETNQPVSSELSAYLQTLTSSEGIHSVELIRFSDQMVLSSDYGQSSWTQAPDNTWIHFIEQIHTKPLLISRRWLGQDHTSGKTELLSLVRPVMDGGRVQGAVLINLDYDRFFSNFYVHLSSSQYVYDLDGNLIYPKLSAAIDQQGMNTVLDQLGVQPYAYVSLNDQDYMANQAFSDVTGWRLVSLVPMEELLKNIRLARNMMLLLSGISIVIGCAAMYYYSYVAFRPLQRINKLLQPDASQPARTSLYELEPVISSLIGDAHSKTMLAERSLPELQAKYVQDILNKNISAREIEAKWNQYFQYWKPDLLYLVVISIDQYGRWSAPYSEADQMLLKYALHNMISEIMQTSWHIVIVNGDRDAWTILLQPRSDLEDPELAERLRHDLLQMMNVTGQHLRLSLSASMGQKMNSSADMISTQKAALHTLAQRLYAGYGQVHIASADHDSMQLLRSAELPPDYVLEQHIQTLLESGNGEQALPQLQQWFQDLRDRRPEPTAVYRYLHRLLEQLLSTADRLHLVLPEPWSQYHLQVLTTLQLDDVQQLLEELWIHLSMQISKQQSTREHQLVESIKRYMEQHLEQNIGLPDIAEHVQLSVSSVSQIFKEQTGSTIYDYLTRLRLEKACQLLRDTNLKIADIAARVGYQNENSFIRTFRKHKSITPGKYREQH